MKFKGKVVKGVAVGKKFGIATANLEIIGEKPEIEEGVYLVRVYSDGCFMDGILHFGARKTFGGEFSVEVHILDFEEDIYDQEVEIEVLQFVRKIEKFQNADALFTQIEQDLVVAEKYFLRAFIKRKWRNMSLLSPPRLAKVAIKKISKYKPFLAAQNIAVYSPLKEQEVAFVERLMEVFPDKKYFFPRVEGKELHFHEVSDFTRANSSKMKKSDLGIWEPEADWPKCHYGALDMIFVPVVAVEQEGNRLGNGWGFYDRFLSAHTFKPECQKVAVVPYFAMVEKVPIMDHDIPVDRVIPV